MLKGTLIERQNAAMAAAQKEVTFAKIVDGLGKLPKEKAQALAGVLHEAFQEGLSREDIVDRADKIGFSDNIKMNGASIATTARGILDAFDRLTNEQQGELTCNHKPFLDIRQGNASRASAVVVETATEVAPPSVKMSPIKATGPKTERY